MWPREFQICGYFGPLLKGHVTRRMRSKLLAFNMGKCKFEAYISLTVQVRRMVTMDRNRKPHMPSRMVT